MSVHPIDVHAQVAKLAAKNAKKKLSLDDLDGATLDPITLKAEKIEWLWEGYFQANRVSLLVGDGGIGKGMLTVSLIADVTKGKYGEPAHCLFVSTEEVYAEETLPRLIAQGADFRYIRFIDTLKVNLKLDVDGINLLGEYIAKHGIKVVYLDPIIDFFPEHSKDSESDVRDVLVPLGNMAQDRSVSIIGLRHVPKGSTSIEDLILGSKAWRNVSRTVLGVLKHPLEPTQRVMVSVKANNGQEKEEGLGFKIVPYKLTEDVLRACGLPWENVSSIVNSTVGRLEWTGEKVDREEVEHAHGRNPKEREEINDKSNERNQKITDYFKNKNGKVPSAQAKTDLVRLLGVSERTVVRACEKLGVQFGKQGDPESNWEYGTQSNSGLSATL